MLTKKGKYGLKAMVHLAGLEPGGIAQVAEIAESNSISKKFLDHILTEAERIEAELHLDDCDWCRRRYRFEASLRIYVHQVVTEPMPTALRQKLAALRIPLN